jgi:hypothetical protein
VKRLHGAGLQVVLYNYIFHIKSTRYLGYIDGIDGVFVDPGKKAVIKR